MQIHIKNASTLIRQDVQMCSLHSYAVLVEVQAIDVFLICRLSAVRLMIGVYQIINGVHIKIVA